MKGRERRIGRGGKKDGEKMKEKNRRNVERGRGGGMIGGWGGSRKKWGKWKKGGNGECLRRMVDGGKGGRILGMV